MTYKRIVARISRFLKIKISKTTSWAALSGELQKKFYDYFNNELKRKYLKKDTLYIISNLLVEDERYGSKSKIYEITTKLDTDEDKQTFIDCISEIIKMNRCSIAPKSNKKSSKNEVCESGILSINDLKLCVNIENI